MLADGKRYAADGVDQIGRLVSRNLVIAAQEEARRQPGRKRRFGPATDKIAAVSGGRQRGERKLQCAEVRLRITARYVGQEIRRDEVADTATDIPGAGLLLIGVNARRRKNSGERALQIHEVVAAENAHHKIAQTADRELIVAAAADRAVIAAAARRLLRRHSPHHGTEPV